MEYNIFGITLFLFSLIIGLKFPDWDFSLKLRHRNILTHSSLAPILLIKFGNDIKNLKDFRFFIIGFSLGLCIHILFDMFPKKWHSAAFLKIPIKKITCSEETTKLFFILTIVINIYIIVSYLKNIYEFLFVFFIGLFVIIKKSKYENRLIFPLTIYIFLLLILGEIQFETIRIFILSLKL